MVKKKRAGTKRPGKTSGKEVRSNMEQMTSARPGKLRVRTLTAGTVRRAGNDTRVKAAKLARVLTVPPVLALFLTTVLYIALGRAAFAAPIRYFEAVFTLTLLPVIPYGLCALIPSWKKQGRKLERSLGIVFSLIGYIMGTLFALLGGGSRIEIILYLTYMMSGLLLGVLTFVFRFKASGHTCGAAGPFAMLTYLMGPLWLIGYAVMIPIFVSSLKLRRHTVCQLLAGAVVSVSSLIAAIKLAALF